MKEDQVPQDDENLLEGKFGVLQYAVDKDGNYKGVQSKGWEPENIALQQAWESINEKIGDAKEQVAEGTASPLLYHMTKNLMDVALLAEHVGFFRWTVKRHLKPSVFNKLSQQKRQKYADVFKISLETLNNTEDY